MCVCVCRYIGFRSWKKRFEFFLAALLSVGVHRYINVVLAFSLIQQTMNKWERARDEFGCHGIKSTELDYCIKSTLESFQLAGSGCRMYISFVWMPFAGNIFQFHSYFFASLDSSVKFNTIHHCGSFIMLWTLSGRWRFSKCGF